jgi:hypothetical protein
MPSETPDLTRLTARLEQMESRLAEVEQQVRGLLTSLTAEARRFVVRDIRGAIRAQLEMPQFAPALTLYDSAGKERLKVGLRLDGSPLLSVEQRETPFE